MLPGEHQISPKQTTVHLSLSWATYNLYKSLNNEASVQQMPE